MYRLIYLSVVNVYFVDLIAILLRAWFKKWCNTGLKTPYSKVLLNLKTEEGITIHFEDGTLIRRRYLGNWSPPKCPRTSTLEKAGVTLNERGFIQVDEYQNTAVVEGIYALGDVIAEKESNSQNKAGQNPYPRDFSTVKPMPNGLHYYSNCSFFTPSNRK